jgi:endonuclease-3
MVDDKKQRARKITTRLKKEYPDAGYRMRRRSAHQILIGTVLSAQTADSQVDKITPGLFRKYPSIKAFAEARVPDLEEEIKAIGLYRNKARAIKKTAQKMMNDFHGEVPDNLDDLQKLPGVGRKTAGVVVQAAFGKSESIVVDTHVKRISKLLGLTDHTDPYKIEMDLQKVVSKKDWIVFTHLLIWHGRAVCIARRPRCAECVINDLCPSAFKV